MQEVVISFKDISGKVALNENETENGSDCHDEVIKAPETGMVFDSLDSLYEYYRQYGRQEGFGVKKKTSRPSPCGKLKFMSLSCNRAGKSMSHKQNYLTPNPLTRIECKARVNATMFEDGKCKINSVALNHNHELSPSKSQFYSCNREKVIGVRRKLNDETVIGARNTHQSLEVGGCDDVKLLENDCVSYSEKGSWLQFRAGDAKAIQDYFVRMQIKNSNFFYMVDMDDDARINNVFWADARSRAMYEEFGDAVTFDTTYLSNKYELPLTSFIGMNHHGQPILLGCALLSNDDPATFLWLFKTWLACMSGRAPTAIITDEHKSMAKAIDVVFPNTRHRWCLSQVMKKLLDSLKGHKTYDHIKAAMQDAIYDSLTKVVKDFNLCDNSRLSSLYDERSRWVPAFLKDAFWAGMSTAQRDESLSPFFNGRVNSKTTLKQFIEEYDKALRNKVEKEHLADFQCFSTWIPCVTLFEVEKQFQVAYTNTKFKEFQKELTGKLYCEVSCVDEKDGRFDVAEVVFVGEKRKQIHFSVQFNAENREVQCTCGLFEFKGILCKHSISVLMKMEIINVPEKYILPRWRKDLKRCHTRVKVGYYDDWTSNLEAQRYEKLRKKFDEAADWAVSSDDKLMMLWNCLDEFQMSKAKPLEG
ncbi:protein FAR-RED IMPAIRED RESPONSE 1-like [Morus notabilis]|uniref:protein FAR-RED IMPAIRED RESPONSE 1-like n=1 Tax=Morus notabilis TaxID=981085 RepID=UPI000CED32EA|nr:protein FAR-RED IMPAIRED RESPONSE 1-like [Morus notabilis]